MRAVDALSVQASVYPPHIERIIVGAGEAEHERRPARGGDPGRQGGFRIVGRAPLRMKTPRAAVAGA